MLILKRKFKMILVVRSVESIYDFEDSISKYAVGKLYIYQHFFYACSLMEQMFVRLYSQML
jgi:hypothetical protein